MGWKSIVSWIFGIFMILGGLGLLTENLAVGVIGALIGLFAVPKVRARVSELVGYEFSTGTTVLVIIIGLGIMSALAPSSMTETETLPSTDNNQDANNNQKTPADNTGDVKTRADRTHSVGESFKIGKIEYKVTDVRTREFIGDNRYTRSEAQGTFVLVDLTVTNRADETVSISNSHMKLVDNQSRSYSVDSQAFMNVEESFTFTQLNPDLSTSGTLVYDVPQDQVDRELKISPVALFSLKEPHYVDLQS